MRRTFTPNLMVSCYTACWTCRFGECNHGWHSRADPDDVWLWERGELAGPDPRTVQCGCWCQFYVPKPLIHKGKKYARP